MKTPFPSLLILLATLASSGCVVIEKKTMVMIVPPESNEIHLYYVFEGISVLEDSQSTLARAQGELDGLKNDDFSFFVSGTGKGSPLLQHCRFDKLRFFVNPGRKRSLCADRRMTILNRADFAKLLNKSISESLFLGGVFEHDEKAIREVIKKASDAYKKEDARKAGNDLGVGPLLKTAEGLFEIASGFDLASIKRLKGAVKDGFRWIRFEPYTVRFVLPATPECAKRIVANPGAKDWLKEMRTFIEPIDLETGDDGLAIVLGKKGQVIRLTYVDKRPYRPSEEHALAKYAGSPKVIMLNDKRANADRLIELFIAEKAKKR